MKIRINRGKGSTSISFHAEGEEDAVNLKEAVLEAARNKSGFDAMKLLGKLEEQGYDAPKKEPKP